MAVGRLSSATVFSPRSDRKRIWRVMQLHGLMLAARILLSSYRKGKEVLSGLEYFSNAIVLR